MYCNYIWQSVTLYFKFSMHLVLAYSLILVNILMLKWYLLWPYVALCSPKYKPCNSSTPLQQFLAFSLTSQREREAVKDESTYYGAMYKWEQHICVSALILCIMRRNWPYHPTASGSYGRQTGWQSSRGNMGGS